MTKNRKKSTVLIVLGFLLVVMALCLTLYNIWNDIRAEQLSEETFNCIMNDLPEDKALPYTSSDEMPVKIIDGHEYVAILNIPDIDIELPVAASWDYNQLRISPCRYMGTTYNNDIVICAHNYQSHFGRLKELSPGATLSLLDMNGNFFKYRVAEIETLLPTAIDDMINSDYDLTLFTCTIGGRTRVTVRCDRIN